ncbi:MAG: ABC transporter ATP-binding protein [Frankiaceae bacterium]|nr:ABC transporter ATP-binding protein [Arenimonas sp.]
MLGNAVAEVVSLGLLIPFLGILTSPDRVMAHPMISSRLSDWGIQSAPDLVLPLTLAFVTAVLASAGLRLLLLWSTTRYSLTSAVALSGETYRKTLYQPYLVHLARHSSGVISGITTKINSVVFGVLTPVLVLISSSILLVAIIAALVVIDPVVAVTSAVVLAGCYGAITWLSRKRLARNSYLISEGQTELVRTLQDGLGGIRDILLDGTQPVYSDIYQQVDRPLRQAQCDNTFISQSPRLLMEALGMVMIAILAYGLSRSPGGIAAAVPVLGALALGAQRLLPALQQAYSAWQSIAGNYSSLADVVDLLDQDVPAQLMQAAPPPLPFHQEIRLDGVRFRYRPDSPWVLNGLDLRIAKGSRVGFVGTTGSGKSTTLDLVMGLLTPTEGRLSVDGVTIDEGTVRAWQQWIAHVPQSIYLAGASLGYNIAFGVPADQVAPARIRRAAQQAQILDFIESGAGGFDAQVGERGVRLSGGQRQRIGIARALHKRASLLVFDEATSALDGATEQSVMTTIHSLDRGLTILIIAHRLTTVRHCDQIVMLEDGQVVAIGNYDELMDRSPGFRDLVNLAG